MVNGVTTTTDTTAAAAAMKKSLGMNKDDFLKLFVAQLQYQDPLKPQDPSAMLDQLSQLSLVEQSYNSNTALNNLLTAQKNASTLSSVSLIGKTVKANGNAVAFDGLTPQSLQFSQSVPTTSSTVTIVDAAGRVVRTAAIGALTAGDASFTWDGLDNNGAQLPAGTYSFNVSGTSASGAAVNATTYTTGHIDGIANIDGSPALTMGSVFISLADVISVKGV